MDDDEVYIETLRKEYNMLCARVALLVDAEAVLGVEMRETTQKRDKVSEELVTRIVQYRARYRKE